MSLAWIPGGGAVSLPVQDQFLNSHARYAAHTARALGYEFRSLDGADGYLFEVRSAERSAVLAAGYATPYALNSASAYSLARDKDFANRTLARAGLPIIPSRLFFTHDRKAASRSPGREREDARAFALGAEWPLFCKPNDGGRGRYAQQVSSAAQFEDYLDSIAPEHEAALVQPVLVGAEYRVFVLLGRALFSYRKTAPPGTPANRSRGGGAADFRDGAQTLLATLSHAAVDALGLSLAGVDVFDLSPERDLSELVVIEINANPGIETLEGVGRWDLIETVWGANFDVALK